MSLLEIQERRGAALLLAVLDRSLSLEERKQAARLVLDLFAFEGGEEEEERGPDGRWISTGRTREQERGTGAGRSKSFPEHRDHTTPTIAPQKGTEWTKAAGGREQRTAVPRERILGTPRSGVGCLHEQEYVILAGPGSFKVGT